jgi:hypothetical protein
MIISAKISSSLGEIMMSYCGKDMYEYFDIKKNFEENH